MAKHDDDPVAERLRAFVRDRVHKEGKFYRRGAATRLAKHLHKPDSWVSHYIDNAPDRRADLDEALAICEYFGVSIEAFRRPAAVIAPPPPELSSLEKEGRAIAEVWPTLSEQMRQGLRLLLPPLHGSKRRRAGG